MLNDPIREAAKDPSCLLCLTPEDGGAWLSPMRQNTPRNFGQSNKNWTDFVDNCADYIANTDDFIFKLEFITHSIGTDIGIFKNIFSGGDRQGSVDIFQNVNDFYIRSFTSSGSLINIKNPVIENDVKNTIIISFVDGTRIISLNGITIYQQTDSSGGFTLNNRPAYITNDNVEIYHISLHNLTTNTLVWQAPPSDLYTTNYVEYDTTPRNFSSSPSDWKDLLLACQSLGAHDCFIEYEYILNSSQSGSAFVLHGTFLGGYLGTTQTALAYASGAFTTPGTDIAPSPMWDTLVTVKIERSGGTVSITLNGTVVSSRSGVTNRDLSTCLADYAVRSNMDGTIFSARVVDIETGETIYKYPNEAERLGLIQKTNVRTDRGCFESANGTGVWSINTAATTISGTTMMKLNDGIAVDSTKLNKTTGVLNCLATDSVKWVLAFNRTLSEQEIRNLSQIQYRDYAKFPCGAGTFDFEATDISNFLWVFADGTTSTDNRPTRTLTEAQTVKLFVYSSDEWNTCILSSRETRGNYIGDIKDIPSVKRILLNNAFNVTGKTSNIQSDTLYALSLISCNFLEIDLANLPTITFSFACTNVPNVYGALPTDFRAKIITLSKTGISQSDLDNSLINIDAAGETGGTFSATNTHVPTAASATARANLIAKDWTLILDKEKNNEKIY